MRKWATAIIAIIAVFLLLIISALIARDKRQELTETIIDGVVSMATTTTTTTTTTTEATTETTTEATTTTTQAPYMPSPHLTDDKYVSPAFFREQGVLYGNGYRWTWYSEKVLPGGALNIPGRHSDGDYVRDEDGYIVIASPDLQKLPKGTVIETPLGMGKVYDHCPTPGTVDVYTSF